ncbi:hypothetical protein [Cryobacterium psychrophilum]|uniref:Uncharacterized protein n=1 Tax=Cryobacterium psychrophilum TaxID=41988 RepID=A0A4Y8KMY5_9MICO|nr:hypothetical protein [Cryobacterium psychrophilum]TDW31128.1 hypothetical protein EDD25_2923 [Cryobacterium psychrophilum]TFD78575.1 hypothetical protein E3T53_10365 [Cryobacterium psychrophilum]
MFGRRRRVAAALAVSAPAPTPVPTPILSDEQILELLHDKVAELVGVNGLWTLVPRSADDTDVFFHGLKAAEIATALSTALRVETARLAGSSAPSIVPAVVVPAKTGRLAKARAAVIGDEAVIEPTALSWTPAPISVWAEPARATVTGPVQLPSTAPSTSESARLVA